MFAFHEAKASCFRTIASPQASVNQGWEEGSDNCRQEGWESEGKTSGEQRHERSVFAPYLCRAVMFADFQADDLEQMRG